MTFLQANYRMEMRLGYNNVGVAKLEIHIPRAVINSSLSDWEDMVMESALLLIPVNNLINGLAQKVQK